MAIEPDPKSDTIPDSDDEFDKAFSEFASGDKPDPDPEEGSKEPETPDGNGPAEDEPSAPAEGDEPDEGKSEEAATDDDPKSDEATSGDDAKKPDGSQPSDDQAPDPWADAPPELKAQLEQLQKERDEALHRASSDANRVAALSRKLHQLSMAGQSSGEKPQDEQPTEAQKALDNKIKQLKEDYGDIAEPLIELIEAQRKELTTVRTQLEGLSEERQAQVIAAETAALEERHPDWRTIAQSPDFSGWLQYQPDNIQRLATSWDARETSVVLTLFKAERAEADGQKPPEEPPVKQPPDTQQQQKPDAATGGKRSQQLEGGRDVRSRPAPAASGPPEDFDAAFDFFVQKKRLGAGRR